MRELPDFDVLVDMARHNPDALEDLRLRLTEQVIEAQPDHLKKQGLRGLAFQIDMERKRARTPMAATIKLSEMMCWKLAELNRCFLKPEDVQGDIVREARPLKANVIELKRPPH